MSLMTYACTYYSTHGTAFQVKLAQTVTEEHTLLMSSRVDKGLGLTPYSQL